MERFVLQRSHTAKTKRVPQPCRWYGFVPRSEYGLQKDVGMFIVARMKGRPKARPDPGGREQFGGLGGLNSEPSPFNLPKLAAINDFMIWPGNTMKLKSPANEIRQKEIGMSAAAN
jgi:hypothetical protein